MKHLLSLVMFVVVVSNEYDNYGIHDSDNDELLHYLTGEL